MNLESLTLAKKAKLYLKLRDKKAEIKKELEEQLKPINAAMAELEATLIQDLNANELDNFKSEAGTVYKLRRTSVSVRNRDEFMDFVQQTDNFEAVDVRANKKVVEELLRQGTEVPGVSFNSETTIGVRRA